MALVLTRKLGEAVLVGDVRIEVVRITGNSVRLAFAAPDGVRILREEVEPRATPDRPDLEP